MGTKYYIVSICRNKSLVRSLVALTATIINRNTAGLMRLEIVNEYIFFTVGIVVYQIGRCGMEYYITPIA